MSWREDCSFNKQHRLSGHQLWYGHDGGLWLHWGGCLTEILQITIVRDSVFFLIKLQSAWYWEHFRCFKLESTSTLKVIQQSQLTGKYPLAAYAVGGYWMDSHHICLLNSVKYHCNSFLNSFCTLFKHFRFLFSNMHTRESRVTPSLTCNYNLLWENICINKLSSFSAAVFARICNFCPHSSSTWTFSTPRQFYHDVHGQWI